jgi:2-octaprenylphenol hydroxylase
MSAPRRLDFDALVVGAGMVGAASAALLASEPELSGWRIGLLDPAPRLQPSDDRIDLRVSALSRGSERLLRSCGAWSALEAQASPYADMLVWDASGRADGPEALRFSAAELAEPNLGHIVENLRVQAALLDALDSGGRVTRLSSELATLDLGEHAVRVSCADGRRLECGLLVGADGAASRVRELLGIDRSGAAYPQQAVVAHLRSERPHRATAYQRFLPGGPLALLPLRDGRVSLVWTVPAAEAAELVACEPVEFGLQVSAASDRVLGALELDSPRGAFPLSVWSAREYCRERCVLVGDAAHTVHPLAGQGVNLGLLDAATLAQVLGDAVEAGDEASERRVLRRYERWRRSENALMQALTDGINQLFGVPGLTPAAMRRTGLALVAGGAPLRRRLAEHALGTVGDLPRRVLSAV